MTLLPIIINLCAIATLIHEIWYVESDSDLDNEDVGPRDLASYCLITSSIIALAATNIIALIQNI